MIRLIALDLDGTLLDPAGRITQASKDAIARARAMASLDAWVIRPAGSSRVPSRSSAISRIMGIFSLSNYRNRLPTW